MQPLVNDSWPVKLQLAAWRKATKGKGKRPIGSTLTLLDGQRFTLVKRLVWNYAKPKRKQISYVFESRCILCEAPYVFNVPSYASSLVRNCPKHRGQYRKPARPKPPAKPAQTPLRDLILATLDQAALLGSISHGALIAQCITGLPLAQGKRDTRRQRITESLQGLLDSGKLPCVVTDSAFVFS